MSFQKKLFISIGLAAALYLGVSIWLGWREVIAALAGFQWAYLPVCLLLAFGNYLIRFLKWHYYLGILQIPLAAGLSLRVFLAGMVMTATPGKFGEVFKSYLLKNVNGAPLAKSAPIVLAERLTDFIAFVLLALLGVTLLPNGPLVFAVSIGIIVVVLALASWKRFVEGCINSLERWPRIAPYAEKIHTAYESTYRMIAPKPLVVATLISVVSWWFECLAFYLVILGFGQDVPLVSATFIYAFGTILGALLMTPGGIGPAEVSMGGLLVLLHNVSAEVAGPATLIIRLCTLWFAVAVGLIVLLANAGVFEATVHEIEEQDAHTPEGGPK